jgi:hypothetical protein
MANGLQSAFFSKVTGYDIQTIDNEVPQGVCGRHGTVDLVWWYYSPESKPQIACVKCWELYAATPKEAAAIDLDDITNPNGCALCAQSVVPCMKCGKTICVYHNVERCCDDCWDDTCATNFI